MFVHDQNEQPPIAAGTNIPMFYLGEEPPSQPLTSGLGAQHAFVTLSLQASVVRQLKNPYSLRCIAEHFVRVIREHRPRGPYMLGGWRAHGVLALETAQILREQGQDVALLVLLETINPERLRQRTRLGRVMATVQAKMNLLELEHKFPHSRKEYVHGRISPRRRGGPLKEMRLTRSTALEVLYTAVGNYLPRPYDSPVLLIRNRDGVSELDRDTYLGWSQTLGKELEVYETEGNHYSMYAEPNLEALVRTISERLKEAERRWQHQRRVTRQIA